MEGVGNNMTDKKKDTREEKKQEAKTEEIKKEETKTEEFQVSETWAHEVIEDIDDFIESQGIYLRQ